MLTRKQYELLVFIDRRLKETGVSPSFDEMKDALDLRSKSGIHRLITGLEERGFIRRLAHRARALEVLRLPENMEGAHGPTAMAPTLAPTVQAPVPVGPTSRPEPSPMAAGPVSGFAPNVIRGAFGIPGAVAAREAVAVDLPLVGRIAAGYPAEKMQNAGETFGVPASLLGRGEHFALEVEGESMVEAGIHDGDVAIIRKTKMVESGTIVVALVDGSEVTLKRLRRRGKSIALEPANPSFETRIFGPDQVEVQGELVGLIRRY